METFSAGAAMQANRRQWALGPVLANKGNAPQKQQAEVSEDLCGDFWSDRKDPAHGHQLRTILNQKAASSEESRAGQAMGQW